MFLATCETRSFTFQAIATSESDARRFLRAGLQRHAAKCVPPLDQGWAEEQDINVQCMEVGICYRDWQVV
jgi:hypothetical protein